MSVCQGYTNKTYNIQGKAELQEGRQERFLVLEAAEPSRTEDHGL